jgi:hypothetical protein
MFPHRLPFRSRRYWQQLYTRTCGKECSLWVLARGCYELWEEEKSNKMEGWNAKDIRVM